MSLAVAPVVGLFARQARGSRFAADVPPDGGFCLAEPRRWSCAHIVALARNMREVVFLFFRLTAVFFYQFTRFSARAIRACFIVVEWHTAYQPSRPTCPTGLTRPTPEHSSTPVRSISSMKLPAEVAWNDDARRLPPSAQTGRSVPPVNSRRTR